MLDRLPVELLSYILRLAVPLDYNPDKHKERLRLLKSCCLTCSALRKVAQPMLTDVVDETALPELLNQRANAIGQRVKVLALDDCRLRCFATDRTPLECPSDLVLPNLVELSLTGDADQPSDLFETLLTVERLPSFRALAISANNAETWAYGERQLPHLPLSLRQQLEVFVTDLGDIPPDQISSLSPVPVLAGVIFAEKDNLLEDPSPLPPFLHVYDLDFIGSGAANAYPVASAIEAFQFLDEFSSCLGTSWDRSRRSTNLQVLVLSAGIRPDLPGQYHILAEAVTSILKRCRDIGVEVLWSEEAHKPTTSLVTPVFWEWCKKKKREREAVDGGKGKQQM
ncbi:hypothetical protein JCM6882_005031 [Rhodosporidiobolus microsporus]